jgi:hypothetical protein
MAGRTLVTIGSDGVTDWVRTPDGQRFNLGPISALRFVSSLVSRSQAKRTLNTFLGSGEAMLSVDEDRMWALLAPRRATFTAHVSSSMTSQERKGETMSTIAEDLSAVETHIAALNEAASKKASNLGSGVEQLFKLAGKIVSPNQSKNKTYYNLGAPKVEEVKSAGLSFDVFQANTELANTILATTEQTAQRIERLASTGRKFNASKALSDVRSVSSKVAGILAVDLTASWVRGDLEKLASRADELAGLFASAKV